MIEVITAYKCNELSNFRKYCPIKSLSEGFGIIMVVQIASAYISNFQIIFSFRFNNYQPFLKRTHSIYKN